MSKKAKMWTGSTDGPGKLDWPQTWSRHPRDRDCLYAECDECVVVHIDGKPTACFLHFWASAEETSCRGCMRPHPRISFDARARGTHAQTFALFRRQDGPRAGESPFRVLCRDCAHRLWAASERFLDGLDRPELTDEL